MKDNEWRECVAVKLGDDHNCEYMKVNKYNQQCCGIDGINNIKWFGCIPAKIKNFIELKEKFLLNK